MLKLEGFNRFVSLAEIVGKFKDMLQQSPLAVSCKRLKTCELATFVFYAPKSLKNNQKLQLLNCDFFKPPQKVT